MSDRKGRVVLYTPNPKEPFLAWENVTNISYSKERACFMTEKGQEIIVGGTYLIEFAPIEDDFDDDD
tara:strand:- start:2283 stop:2483 length:201 start_codon:yes stop_codon:yes gene_type:complete